VPGAIGIYQKLLEQIQAAKPAPEVNLLEAVRIGNLYRAEAALQRRARRAELASALEAQYLQLWQHWDSKLPNNALVRRQLEAVRLP
jgi:hypothetical protein